MSCILLIDLNHIRRHLYLPISCCSPLYPYPNPSQFLVGIEQARVPRVRVARPALEWAFRIMRWDDRVLTATRRNPPEMLVAAEQDGEVRHCNEAVSVVVGLSEEAVIAARRAQRGL